MSCRDETKGQWRAGMRSTSLFWLLRSQMIKSNLQKEWAHIHPPHFQLWLSRYYCCKSFLSDSASLALHGGELFWFPTYTVTAFRRRVSWPNVEKDWGLLGYRATGACPGGSGSLIKEWVTVYSIIGFGGFAVQCRPYLLVSKYLVMNQFLPITLQVWIKIPAIHKFNLALRKKVTKN